MKITKAIPMVFCILVLSSCATQKDCCQIKMTTDKIPISPKHTEYEKTLQFQFFGAAGGMLSLADEGLLIDPFVSNPPISKLIFGTKLEPDCDLIKITFTNLDVVRGIIVSHGHYDHLMDVPAVIGLEGMPEEVSVYVDQVSAYQLKGFESTNGKVKVIDQNLSAPYDKKYWQYLPEKNIKIYPVRSDHAPNVWRFRFPYGTRNKPMGNKKTPRTFYDWKAGDFLNYAVVITNPISKASFRVYIQSSASDGAIGSPPAGMIEDIGEFDLLILSAASHDKVDDYPSMLLEATKAREVIIVHWDDFFGQGNGSAKQPKVAPGVNLETLMEKIYSVDPSIKVSIPTRNSIVKIYK